MGGKAGAFRNGWGRPLKRRYVGSIALFCAATRPQSVGRPRWQRRPADVRRRCLSVCELKEDVQAVQGSFSYSCESTPVSVSPSPFSLLHSSFFCISYSSEEKCLH